MCQRQPMFLEAATPDRRVPISDYQVTASSLLLARMSSSCEILALALSSPAAPIALTPSFTHAPPLGPWALPPLLVANPTRLSMSWSLCFRSDTNSASSSSDGRWTSSSSACGGLFVQFVLLLEQLVSLSERIIRQGNEPVDDLGQLRIHAIEIETHPAFAVITLFTNSAAPRAGERR